MTLQTKPVRNCLYCGGTVATNAHRCPHCGARGPGNKVAFFINTRWKLIGLGCFGLVALLHIGARIAIRVMYGV